MASTFQVRDGLRICESRAASRSCRKVGVVERFTSGVLTPLTDGPCTVDGLAIGSRGLCDDEGTPTKIL